MNSTDRAHTAVDKDLPLKEDIRLLGRLLGDTLREQEGDETFELIEHIRQTAETLYHPVGTCKMGNDATTVVDDRLRAVGLGKRHFAECTPVSQAQLRQLAILGLQIEGGIGNGRGPKPRPWRRSRPNQIQGWGRTRFR